MFLFLCYDIYKIETGDLMKTKNKYAIVLLCILSLSVLLLSLSYAKNSELGIKSTKDTLEKEEFQVVCSSSCSQIKTNEEIHEKPV